jgi:hypothetical protein
LRSTEHQHLHSIYTYNGNMWKNHYFHNSISMPLANFCLKLRIILFALRIIGIKRWNPSNACQKYSLDLCHFKTSKMSLFWCVWFLILIVNSQISLCFSWNYYHCVIFIYTLSLIGYKHAYKLPERARWQYICIRRYNKKWPTRLVSHFFVLPTLWRHIVYL